MHHAFPGAFAGATFAILCASSCSATPPAPPRVPLVIYVENGELFTVPVSGGANKKLGNLAVPRTFVALVGDRIVFSSSIDHALWDLYSVKVDGTGEVPLATSAANETLLGVIDGRAIIQRDAASWAAPPVEQAVLSVPLGGGRVAELGVASALGGSAVGRVTYGRIFIEGGNRLLTTLADGTGVAVLLDRAGQVSDLSGSRVALLDGAWGVSTGRLDGSDHRESGLSAYPTPLFGEGFAALVGAGFVGDRLVFGGSQPDPANPGKLVGVALSWSGMDQSPVVEGDVHFPVVGGLMDVVAGKAIMAAWNDAGQVVLALDPLTAHAVNLCPASSWCAYAGQGGGRIALVVGGAMPADAVSVLPDGSGLKSLGSGLANGLSRDWTVAGSDPTMRRIAWVGDRFLYRQVLLDGNSQLQSVLADGTGRLTITPEAASVAAVAVRGSTVIYRWSTAADRLAAVEVDGTRHRQLSEATPSNFQLMVGDSVVFRRAAGGGWDLRSVPLAGGPPTVLTSGLSAPEAVAAY